MSYSVQKGCTRNMNNSKAFPVRYLQCRVLVCG